MTGYYGQVLAAGLRVSFSGLLLLVTGCTSTFGPIGPHPSAKDPQVTQEDLRRHVIHVDRDGDFYEIPEQVNGKDQAVYKNAAVHRDLAEQTQVMAEAYREIFRGIDAFATNRVDPSQPLNLTIVIHGGLMPPGKKLRDAMEALMLMRKDDVYPVFINWRSGPLTTTLDHFFRIRAGEVSESKITYVTAFPYMALYTLKAVGGAPLAWWRSLKYYYVGTTQPVTRFADPPAGWNTADRFHAEPSEDYRYKWGDAPLYVLGFPSRVIMTPFVYSWGVPAWKNMERRTHAMFIRQKDFNPDHVVYCPEAWDGFNFSENTSIESMPQFSTNAYGAVYYFSLMLCNEFKNRRAAGGKNPWENMEITLIGNSMGSFVINHMLRTTPDLPVANIVYLAAADNLQNYLDIPVEYVKARAREGRDVHVYNLFLHPRNEYTEHNYLMMVPPGSLLTWVDHSIENPEYVLQRTAGRWENMRQVVKLIPEDGLENHFHYKVFGRNKCDRTQPQRHIDFDKAYYRYWRKEFWE